MLFSLPQVADIVGRMSDDELPKMRKAATMILRYGKEAIALFEIINDDFVAAEDHIRSNPPSAGAIAVLVQIAKGRSRSEQAKKSSSKMLADSPKQSEKILVRKCWDAWQDKKKKKLETYKGKTAFAKDMLLKYEHLDNQAVITRWCTTWEKETALS